MTDENDKTQEQVPAPEQPPAAAAPTEEANTVASKTPSRHAPNQKTINVVGSVVIATLLAIVLAQAMGSNNELSANEVRLPGGPPNGQFQGPGQMGPGQMGPGQSGQGQMGPGPHGKGDGWRSQDDDSDKSDDNKSDDKDDERGTSQSNPQPAPRSRAS